MPILIEQPIVVPEKTFDKYWICSITINAASPTSEADASVLLLPYNGQTGETFDSGIKPLQIKDIMAKCAANPDGNFAKAMHYLIEAVNEEKEAQEASIE